MAQQMVYVPITENLFCARGKKSFEITATTIGGALLPANHAVCELVPADALTVQMTEERVEALETILDMAIGDAGEGWASEIIQELLAELKGGNE